MKKRTTLQVSMILALVAGLPALSAAENNILDEMRRCALIGDSTSRLACYDELSDGEASGAPIVPESDPPRDDASGLLNASVVNCTRDPVNNKYIFHLRQGQVWKQISDRKLSYKTCEFDVVIMKDFFGFKMQVAGEKSRIRVKRIR